MSKYQCPLCKQEVSKALYEKITGIWQEKERKLHELKQKERELARKEKNLRQSFQQKKVQLEQQFDNKIQSEIKKQERLFNQARRADERKWAKQFKEIENTAKKKAEDRITKERRSLDKKERVLRNRNERLLSQFRSQQIKHQSDLDKREQKIRSLEEQLKKNQTPQVLGLLEEKAFLAELKKAFPKDRFEHTGKKGDIVHYIVSSGNEVGCIVYELKKVAKFDRKHIEQTLKARNARLADYGVLVTNAKRTKTDMGFSVLKNVLIIHPAGAIVLAKILRDHLVNISQLKLKSSQRSKSVAAILNYVQGAEFKNSLESIIQHTIDLYDNMQDEVKKHVRTWKYRLNKYRSIKEESHQIQHGVFKKPLPGPIEDIEVPRMIK